MKKDSIKNGNNSTTEDTYRLLFDANRDSITIFKIDSQGIPSNFIEANPATSELLGYTKKELLSLSITDLENTTEEVRNQRLQTFKSEGKLDFETIIKNKNGEELYVETKTILINYLNEPAIMNITRDITEKKILEYTLKNTNENLRCILEAIPDLLFEVGIDGHIYHYQAHREDLLAAEPSMFLGKRMQDIIPEPAASICLEALIEANENGWSTGKEYALDLPKGKCWFEISVSPIIKSDPNNKRFIMLARDTSYRKFAEKERIENKENLQSIFDTVSEAIYVLDELGTFIDVNKGAEKMYLYSKKELIGKTPLDVAAPGLNNFDEVNKSIQAVFDNGIPVFLEFWAVRKNGEIFPKEVVLNKGKYSGKTVLIITARDISLQKEKEKTLLKTQEKLSSIFNLANSGIVLGDIEGNLLEFNDWWLEMLGYTAEEYAKLKMFGVTHPDDLEVSQQWLKRIVSGEIEKYKIEKRYIRKDGSVFWGESSVSVIKDKNNNITSTVGIVTDISERKITEESLRESEEKYRNLVENSPDGIFIFIDNKFAYANDEGLRIIKATSKQEIIGQTILQFIHPDNKQSAINSLKTILQSVVTSNLMEDKFITLDGDTIYVELKAIPIVFEKQNALQVIVHDITERKRTQDKIKQLSRAVEQSPVSIAITNTIGVLEYVNPKFMETTGYSLEELIGNKTNLLKSGHTSKKQYKNLWATITSGHEWYGEFRNKRKDGTLFWESASISPITNSHGITTHYIAIKEDITERKQIEQDLIKAKEKAEESDRLKLVFLANMSHEIRTPMNGILGFTELLKSPDLSKMKQQKFIKIIEESGHRMLNIINDIINISKIESGQIEVNLSETNINEQIEYLFNFFKPEAALKNIRLPLPLLLSDKDTYIKSDLEKIYAIFTNLIKNAIKFTNKGTIEFGCIKKGDYLEFFVKDSGIGVSEQKQKIIFERFRQANESITRIHEGSGLGLAISKAYVEILGGTIWVESDEKNGSTFYFTLPIDPKYIPEKLAPTKSSITSGKQDNKIQNLKILIVEDDSISKLLITIAVKPFSNNILKVSTGVDAVESCRKNPDIDLVMMDINMPKMGGYEATKQIREFNKDIVIIAQTANGMQSDRDKALDAGCTDYISKPVNIKELEKLIHKHFKR